LLFPLFTENNRFDDDEKVKKLIKKVCCFNPRKQKKKGEKMLSFKLFIFIIVLTNFLISTYCKAHFEPFPFHEEEVDEDLAADQQEDPNDESEMLIERDPHTQRILSTDGKLTHKDIIRKNLFSTNSKGEKTKTKPGQSSSSNSIFYDHEGMTETDIIREQAHPQNKETNILKIIGDAERKANKVKMRYPVKVGHVCPLEDSPKIGDRITLHIPSREHLVPRFTGMRVFAPPHAEYHDDQRNGFRDSKHIFDHHTKSKLLYVFDEHIIQGVWPVHDTLFAHRNLKVVVNDVHVQEDPNEPGTQLCYVKVAPNY
jgi:hypothetical protein